MAKHPFVPLCIHRSGPPHHSLAWCVSEVWISRPFLDITQRKEEPDNKQRDILRMENTDICNNYMLRFAPRPNRQIPPHQFLPVAIGKLKKSGSDQTRPPDKISRGRIQLKNSFSKLTFHFPFPYSIWEGV
jgi:hypothetical protein